MNDNLKQLLKEATQSSTPPVPPDVYIKPEAEQEAKKEKTEEEVIKTAEKMTSTSGETTISVIPLNRWLPKNIAQLENIKMVTISVRDVPPDLDIVVAVPDIDDPNRKRLKIIENANIQPMLDLPGIGFSVYNSGMTMLFSNPKFPKMLLKGYTLRNNLIITCCLSHSGILLPYHMQKIKKKDTAATLPIPDGFFEKTILKKLEENLDKEAFGIRYKQSLKSEELVKVKDAVDWILKRYAETTDVNHLIQIDSALMFTLIN